MRLCVASELLHLPGKPAGAAEKKEGPVSSNFLHLPDEPAGVGERFLQSCEFIFSLRSWLRSSRLPSRSADAKPFGIDKRVALTTSQVVGSPEPPLPYRAVEALQGLKIPFPIAIKLEPDSDRYLFIAEDHPTARPAAADEGRSQDAQVRDAARHEGRRLRGGVPSRFQEERLLYVGSNGPMPAATKTTRVTRYTDRSASRRTHSIRSRRRSSSNGPPTATTAATWRSATTACSTSPPATAPPTRTPTSSART